MTTERTAATATRSRTIPLGPCLIAFFVGATVLSAWFLIRPLHSPFASLGYYHPPAAFTATYAFNKAANLLFVPYALALFAWWRGQRVAFRWILGGAVLLHVMVVLAPPPGTQDVNQYLFYGRMWVVHHFNPYVVQPAAPRALNMDPWFTTWIKWPTQTSVYGPVWTLLTAGVVAVAGNSHSVAYVAMKLVVLALDLFTMWMIVVAARDAERDGSEVERFGAGFGLLVYAWNPLILLTVPLAGLADVALAAGLTAAYVARRRGHPWVTTVLLTLASLVKIYAVVALLLHLVVTVRQRGWRRAGAHTALAGGLAVAAFAPFWAGLATFTGLLHVAGLTNHSLAGTVQRVLTPALRVVGVPGPYRIAGDVVRWVGTGLLIWSAVWVTARAKEDRDVWRGAVLILSVYFLVTPWFLYWYLVAPIALLALMPRDRLMPATITASGTLLITTAFWPWLLAQIIEVTLRYAPPLYVYARLGRRRTGTVGAAPVVDAPGPGVEPLPTPASPGGASLARDATAAR